jgi:EpsG family
MIRSLADNYSGAAPVRRQTSFGGKAILLTFVTAAIFVVNLFIHPNRFADYDSYIQYTDYIYNYAVLDQTYFEALSSLMLFSFRDFTGNTEQAVNISHNVLGLVFLLFNYFLIRNDKINWQGYIVFIALYGSLMAFVTFRATPAYLLVTIAFFNAIEGKKRSYLYIAISSLFHVSAIIVILFCESKFDFIKKISINKYFIVFIVLLFSLIYYIYGNLLLLKIIDILSSVPFLGKYIAYSTQIDVVSGVIVNNGQDRFFHVIYAISVSLFVIAIISSNNENCIRIRNAVLIGYLMFIFMQFSPTSAFRQSIFWMTPALLVYPWSKLHFKQYGVIPFVVLCVGLAVYQFQGTYS